MKKGKARLSIVVMVLILAGIALGQGPCQIPGCSVSFPPLRYIMLFTNVEDKIGTLQTSPVFRVLSGTYSVGAVPAGIGADLRLYSNLGTPDSNLEVLNPLTGETVWVRNDPQRAASIIRDYYLEYNPKLTSFQRANWYVTFLDYDTQYPVFSLALFPTPNAGTGGIHRIKLLAFPSDVGLSNEQISIKIVDSAGEPRAWLDRSGRELLIRQGDIDEAGLLPLIFPEKITPMEDTPPGPVLPLGYHPTITIGATLNGSLVGAKQLGLVQAEIWGLDPGSTACPYLPDSHCYSIGPIPARLTAERRNDDDTWTYTFIPEQELLPETSYMFVIRVGIEDSIADPGGIPPSKFQAGTQDLDGNLVCYYKSEEELVVPEYCDECVTCAHSGGCVPMGQNPWGCDLGILTQGVRNHIRVWPFFFRTDSGNLTMPVLNPDNLPLIPADVVIKPEVLNINDGVFTAIVSFPQSYDVSTITSCYANGAPAVRMNLNADGKFLICHFEREQITYDMGTLFIVYGQTSDGYYFTGMDRIKRVIK